MNAVQTPIHTGEDETVSFVPRSISWRSDILSDAEKLVTNLAREKGRRANLSEFVNEAVKEKLTRLQPNASETANPLQELIRKEFACLLAQPPRR